MDPVKSINKLRASFLSDSIYEDQAKRIIQPFTADSELPAELRDLYLDNDGKNLLDELESPPIAGNCIDRIPSLQKTRFERAPGASGDLKTTVKARGTKREIDTESESQSKLDATTCISRTPTKNPIGRSSLEADLTQVISAGKAQTQRVNSSGMKDSNSSTQESKTKRKALSLSKIFKGHNHDSGNRTSSAREAPLPTESTQKSHSFYDADFNYDETFEDDDEDDDDDDDDAEQNDEFFLSGIVKSPNGSATKSNKASKLANFPRYAQNVLSASDAKSNTTSLHPDENSAASLHTEGSSHTSERAEISELDSYMNEDDLQDLDLESGKLTVSRTDDQNGTERSRSAAGYDGSDTSTSGVEDLDPSDKSSYGRSLLDSDSQDLEESAFIRTTDATSSAIDDSILADDLLHLDSMPGHSVPRSETFKLLAGSQQSAFMKGGISARREEERLRAEGNDAMSSRCSRHSSFSSRRNMGYNASFQNGPGKVKDLTQRHSNENLQSGSVKAFTKHRRTPSDSMATVRPPKTTFEPLQFVKVEPNRSNSPAGSQLTGMLNEKKSKASNPLEYFSFVSGENVIKSESMTLRVYIHDSEKFKRDPLTASVRKTASAFEVIGFILYLYSTSLQQANSTDSSENDFRNPNRFVLKIVDEDGEPFEDNFGIIDRKSKIGSLFDNELVLCKAKDQAECEKNEVETPLPYVSESAATNEGDNSSSGHLESAINQLSYYTPIIKRAPIAAEGRDDNLVEVKIYLYPNLNPEFNFTSLRVSVSTPLSEVLLRYCKMKAMNAADYALKICDKRVLVDLDESVGELDGSYKLELINKKEVKTLNLKKMKKNIFGKPVLPTIQSADLTPITLDNRERYLSTMNTVRAAGQDGVNQEADKEPPKPHLTKKGSHGRYRHGLSKVQQAGESNNATGGFFKLKNSSKSSLRNSNTGFQPSYPNDAGTNMDISYKDVFAGAYYKYKVWRRQQMSFINKHERTLAIDGDYIYLIPPEDNFNWHHESIKTKCFHMSQVTLIQRSKRVPEYFKMFINKPSGLKRYYFEAVNSSECAEVVARIQKLIAAYGMNHK